MILENCRFEDHSTGVSARMGSEVFMRDCTFANCSVGLDVSDSCQVTLEGVSMDHQEGKYGMILETDKVAEDKPKEIYSNFSELPR